MCVCNLKKILLSFNERIKMYSDVTVIKFLPLMAVDAVSLSFMVKYISCILV